MGYCVLICKVCGLNVFYGSVGVQVRGFEVVGKLIYYICYFV